MLVVVAALAVLLAFCMLEVRMAVPSVVMMVPVA